MKRLCFLLADIQKTRAAVAALHRAGIDEPNIMVVARPDIELQDLPAASIDGSDAMPGLIRGLVLGALAGIVCGFATERFNFLGAETGSGIILMLGFIGAVIGGFATLIASAALPNSRLRPFKEAIERGRIVLMVDVANSRERRQIEDLLRANAECIGSDLQAPILPR
jgi:uncharacterized membrane protein YeaQ/YmgE (transglycosylase-associated protein family)